MIPTFLSSFTAQQARRLPMAGLALLAGACVQAPSESCERTLSCADAAVVQPEPNCQWQLSNGEPWEEAPIRDDAGIWTWYGRELEITAECDPTLPPTVRPPAPSTSDPESTPALRDAATSSSNNDAVDVDASLPQANTTSQMDAAPATNPSGMTLGTVSGTMPSTAPSTIPVDAGL